jgi:hypothetical protein
MDSKKIEQADRKFIDELPQYRSKLTQRQKQYVDRSHQKGIRLPLVQVIAPVLITVVGVVVIYLMPDKLPSDSQSEDSQVSAAQAQQPQTNASLAPFVPGRDENTPTQGSEAAQRPKPVKKPLPDKASTVHADKVKTETDSNSKNRATAEMSDPDLKQISLMSAVVCEGVQDRQPMVEKHDFLTADRQRVYVWMEVLSKSQPFVIKHNYYLNGQKHSQVSLKIKHPRMRTWSYVTVDKAEHIGDWRVDIVRNDSILKTVEFQVSAGNQ